MLSDEDFSSDNLMFSYFIVLESKSLSFYNEYVVELIERADVINKVLELPIDCYELYDSKENNLCKRINGHTSGYRIKFIQSVDEFIHYKSQINCVIVDSLSFITEINSMVDAPVLYMSNTLSTRKDLDLYNFSDVNAISFRDIIESLVSKIGGVCQDAKNEIEKLVSEASRSDYIGTDCEFVKTLYTHSNLVVLKSMRVLFNEVSNSAEWSESNVVGCINLINNIRSKIISNVSFGDNKAPIYDFILSDLSYDVKFHINKSNYSKKKLRDNDLDDVDGLDAAIKNLKKDRLQYSGTTGDVEKDKYLSERYLIEKLIAVGASSYAVPNIKLPLLSRDYYPLLKIIGQIDRGRSYKMNEAFKLLISKFEVDIDDRLDYFKNHHTCSLKLISNLPIEWLDRNGLPLMIRDEVSRVNISPGVVASKVLLDTENIGLSPQAFKKILVISSFDDFDPLKNQFKTCLETCGFLSSSSGIINHEEGIINIKVKHVEVDNCNELIKVLNENSCAITIFNMHGGHDDNGEGVLALKDEKVSVSDLIGNVQVSPIVILSVCDTCPIDNNHYSTANAMFLLGAKTVIGSALPVLARESAIFVSRLLIRISSFLYIHLFKLKQDIRWSSFVSGLLKMSYYTELIDSMKEEYEWTSNEVEQLRFFVNMKINPLHPDWHEKILQHLACTAGISFDDIQEYIRKEFMFPECLKYTQLGNPELITITADNIE
ncbi:hypothetical protein [Maridesulfovibrio ferrireducens]|uniref:hypothetical protein n=1 Tax=Maridesulfovibrio ferrireducens TaxID=246191 RepID=UPI001A356642|nr:hypothetical protein [Maridesulfovibrio ferrireducens]MBI9110308.1 hypothetical protein [Maridesulfovibrio ferrireducens]